MELIRLQKYLSMCSVCSRRNAEKLIEQGQVKVNGRIAKLGDKVDTKRDIVTVGKNIVKIKSEKKYIMLHKPRGFITTLNDEFDRKCITMLLEDIKDRIYPIGRLDKNSEGLLLLTNDGDFANLLMHPRCHVPKTYRVTIKTPLSDEALTALIEGVKLDDGYVTMPAEVSVLTQEQDRIVLRLTIFEGKNRQIRRMCEALNLNLIRLKRIAVGEVKLGMLQQGKWRDLTKEEVRLLYSYAKRLLKD